MAKMRDDFFVSHLADKKVTPKDKNGLPKVS